MALARANISGTIASSVAFPWGNASGTAVFSAATTCRQMHIMETNINRFSMGDTLSIDTKIIACDNV
jgi:hypothetical protein